MGAIGASYATAAQYRARTKKTSTSDDTEVDLDLAAVSRHIERRLGQTACGFNLEASASTRYQRCPAGVGKTLWLDVPVAIAPTSVKIDSSGNGTFATSLTLTEYTGDVIYHPPGWDQAVIEPIVGIELTGQDQWGGLWPHGVNVQIIGTHGWPAVPDPIVAATIALAGILRLEGARATGTLTSADAVLSATPEAVRIVKDLQSTYMHVGAII